MPISTRKPEIKKAICKGSITDLIKLNLTTKDTAFLNKKNFLIKCIQRKQHDIVRYLLQFPLNLDKYENFFHILWCWPVPDDIIYLIIQNGYKPSFKDLKIALGINGIKGVIKYIVENIPNEPLKQEKLTSIIIDNIINPIKTYGMCLENVKEFLEIPELNVQSKEIALNIFRKSKQDYELEKILSRSIKKQHQKEIIEYCIIALILLFIASYLY
jgi:hypothetical protein